MDELLRLLSLVERDLGAADARAELGGRDPKEDPHVVWAPMGASWRVVATFDEPVTDRDAKTERLSALVAPFGAAERISAPLPRGATHHRQQELDEELDALAERAGARAALVIDERSPVVWGTSASRAESWDLETMDRARRLASEARAVGLDPARWLADGAPEPDELAAAGLDETVAQRWTHRFGRLAAIAPHWTREDWHAALQIATAVGVARDQCRGGMAPDRVAEHGATWGVFAKGFAQIYLLTLVFDGPYSELHAEGPLVRALPHIETLVLALPPVEPPPRGAKVIALRRG